VIVSERDEFDFDAWLARSRPPFYKCVRTAADCLALGRGHLRERLVTALACLCRNDGRDVPGGLQPTYEAILQEVQRRAGVGVDLGRLRASLARCKITTAERIAREIIKMDRYLTGKDA
jgi:hypothetical protein